MRSPIISTIAPLLIVLLARPLGAQDASPPLGSVAALAPAGAQRQAGVPVAAPADTDTTRRADPRDRTRPDSAGRLRTDYSPSERFAMRSVMGALGWVGGAYVGAYAGVKLLGTDCSCDDPGFDSALRGAAVGGIVGTTIVVSAMGYGDRCAPATRATLAALGSALGTVAGVFIGFATEHPILGVALGSGVGGASGAALCTAEGPAHPRR